MNYLPPTAGLLALMLGAAGCATKKDIQAAVAPLDQRVAQLETTTADQSQTIEQMDERWKQDVARLEEISQSAQRDATGAGNRADTAQGRADQAMSRANSAHQVGEEASRNADSALHRLSNLGNFKLYDQETVLFKLNSAKLADEHLKRIDSMVANLGQEANYIIEVQGFTDTSGSPRLNDRLSEQRSKEVVRYLVSEHKVPLHRIHAAGLGSEMPVAANKTRDGRQQNRRVEVRVFIQDLQNGSAGTQSASFQ